MNVVVLNEGEKYHHIKNQNISVGDVIKTECGYEVAYGNESFYGPERKAKRSYEVCSRCVGLTDNHNPDMY